MSGGTVKARRVASIALAAAVALGATGCTLYAVQGTRVHYQPSDGVAASVGSLELRNILGISDDGEDVTILLTVINSAAADVDMTFQYVDASGEKVDVDVTVPGDSLLSLTGEDLVLRDVGATVGGRFPLYISAPGAAGEQVLVPLLDGSLAEYSGSVPMPLPSATPSPSSTAVPGDAETEGEDSGNESGE